MHQSTACKLSEVVLSALLDFYEEWKKRWPRKENCTSSTMQKKENLVVIFGYGYECYVLKHNICGDRPEALDGMPDSVDMLPSEFFVNHGRPSVQATTKAIATKVPLSKVAKEPMEVVAVED